MPSFASAQGRALASKQIELTTDLPDREAANLLMDLDDTYQFWRDYFDADCPEPIRCVVVRDLANWPGDPLPQEAKRAIEQKAGTTLTEKTTRDGKVENITSRVFAVADGRTPQHELTHAYMWQTFGRVGPDWFAEGMAEVAANRKGVPPAVRRYLQSLEEFSISSAIDDDDGPLWQVYARRGLLCEALRTSPTHGDTFRDFAKRVLRGEEVDFAKAFPDAESVEREMRRVVDGLPR